MVGITSISVTNYFSKDSCPTFSACSRLSRTNIPEPSPMTKPLRSLSNGIEARVGSSVVERAVRLGNQQ